MPWFLACRDILGLGEPPPYNTCRLNVKTDQTSIRIAIVPITYDNYYAILNCVLNHQVLGLWALEKWHHKQPMQKVWNLVKRF